MGICTPRNINDVARKTFFSVCLLDPIEIYIDQCVTQTNLSKIIKGCKMLNRMRHGKHLCARFSEFRIRLVVGWWNRDSLTQCCLIFLVNLRIALRNFIRN